MPRMSMVIGQNQRMPYLYRQAVPKVNILPNIPASVTQLPSRATIGRSMIISVRNSRSGCSSCGK